MAKVDRLGWAAGIAFSCHGARIGVRVNDPAVLERVAACLPPGSKPTRSPVVTVLYSLLAPPSRPGSHVTRYNLVYEDASRLARTTDLGEALRALEARLQFAVGI